ncbi:MAG TPA: hypothetical protein VMV05_04725, partial [bacterium]|nr:hypothetical protein [bacterium]
MKSRFSSPRVWALPLIGLGLAAGCGVTPMAPGRGVSLAVTLQRLNSISPALLGASQNEIYFHLDGAGAPSGHWAYGPFSAPVSTGSVTITIRIPAGSNASVLSLQLNNASTHQPLALGATQFNYGSGVVVDMGSVTRNCYYTDASNPLLNSGKGSVYIFSSDTLVAGSPTLGSSDIAFNFGSPNQFFMEEAANAAGPVANSIAYMGQGDMVDHDGVPPASAFYPYSYQSKSSAGAAV